MCTPWPGSYDGPHCKSSQQHQIPHSAQRISEAFVPDTLYSMLPGFKKTLLCVLTLISLVCHPGELRGSLLDTAVICPIPTCSLPSISLWYLVKVIFSWKSSALSVRAV